MKISSLKYRILRRIVQFGILLLFLAGSKLGWKILNGNYSAADVFEKFHLTDPFAILQILFSGIMVAKEAIIGALIVLLFYAIIAGRGFCSWVCPVNIISDLAFWIRRKLKVKYQNTIITRNTRYWILGLSLVVSAVAGIAAFELVSPIGMLHRGIIFGMGFGWAVVLCILLFDSFILPHGWCGYLCPLGAFYALTGRFRIVKIKHYAKNCTDCMDCVEICPENQVLNKIGQESGQIKYGACNNCGRCIEACNDNALKYSIKK